MIKPVTPDEVRQSTYEPVDQCVYYINRLLTMDSSIATLRHGDAVPIFDSSGAEIWKAGNAEAVEVFKQHGWRVELFQSESLGPVYSFYLPAPDSPEVTKPE